jgi:hypothetical protein
MPDWALSLREPKVPDWALSLREPQYSEATALPLMPDCTRALGTAVSSKETIYNEKVSVVFGK